jgi:hypothetical protein
MKKLSISSLHSKAPIGYNNNFISNSTSTKFLGVIVENTSSWKAHIDHLLPKLCMACYSVRTIKPSMCKKNLNSIYYSCFHSLMTYGIIFCYASFVMLIIHMQMLCISLYMYVAVALFAVLNVR